MKHRILMGLMPAVVLLAGALLSVSCQEKEPKAEKTVTATVSGTVVDDQENPIGGVSVNFVTADSKKEQKATATTGSDGKFVAENVPSSGRLVNFTKEGYASYSTTIAEARFAEGTIDLGTVELIFSNASIEGKVLTLSGEPYAGVTVAIDNDSKTTDNDGVYSFTGLTVKEYTLKISDTEGNEAEITVAPEDFIDGVAYAPNVTLGSYIMPGISYNELASAPVWYANDYAGGTGAFQAQWNHIGFLTMFPYKAVGYRNAAEGISLVSGGDNPGELVSFVYGRKKISAGNCHVNLCARTFRAYESAPAKIGIGVLDLTSGGKKVVYLPAQDTWQGQKKMKGGTATLDVEHNMFAYDLSEYVGKDIAFGIGVFGGYKRLNEEEGYPETPIVRIVFADKDMTSEFESQNLCAQHSGEKPDGCDWPSFTKANISTLMPNPGTSFTGVLSPAEDGNYAKWAGTNHLMTSWAPHIRNEAVIANQDGVLAIAAYENNFERPTAYIMSRFNGPKKNMTMKVRTYGANESYIRVSVVDLSNFAVTALAPAAGSTETVSGENGTIGVKNDKGTPNNPDDYATLKFDLSSFSGKDVVIVIGNHKGNNVPIYSVDFAD